MFSRAYQKAFVKLLPEAWATFRVLTHYFVFDKICDAIVLGFSGSLITKIFDVTKNYLVPKVMKNKLEIVATEFSSEVSEAWNKFREYLPDLLKVEVQEEDNSILGYAKDFLLPITFKELAIGTFQGLLLYSASRLPFVGKPFEGLYKFAEKLPVAVLDNGELLVGKGARILKIGSQAEGFLKGLISLDFAKGSFVGSLYIKFFEHYHGPMEWFYHLTLFFEPMIRYTGNGLSFEPACDGKVLGDCKLVCDEQEAL